MRHSTVIHKHARLELQVVVPKMRCLLRQRTKSTHVGLLLVNLRCGESRYMQRKLAGK